MAIQWGSWQYSGGNGMRVGVDVSISTVTNGSSSVTFTMKVYTQNQARYSDNQVLTYGGTCGSGTTSYNNSTSGSADLRSTQTCVYNYTTYGSSPGTKTFSATVSGAYNGVTPSVTVTMTIPARPYAVPAAVTALTATRNSDTQITLGWTTHATAGAPYTSQTVQMRTFTGSSWGAWSTIVTASSSATSAVISTGLSANHVYQFQVRSNNTVGSSAYLASSEVPMTPADPSNVVSALGGTGTSITTTWVDNAYVYGSSPITYTIQRSVAGGAYSNVVTGIAQGTHTWTDPSPGAGTNQYKVKAVQATGSLSSGYATGNSVSTIVPPLAPTNLAPNGVSADFAHTNVTLTWTHNSGGDGAPQTHFTLQYSSNGGSSWTTLANDIASATSSYTVTAGTLVNGTPYLWKVKTEGVVSGGYGPYSASAASTGSSTPTVTLSLPAASTTAMPLQAAWAYNQDEASPQAAWQANLYAADGTTLLEALSGSDNASSANFTYILVDGATYVVKVRAQSGAGIWSAWASASTDFDLLPPAAADVVAEYSPCLGQMILHITGQAPVGGVTVAIDTITVERRVAGGDWVVLASGLTVPIDLTDILPLTNGLNEYRITTVSATPSYFTGDPVAAPGTDGDTGSGLWVILNYGNNFGVLLRAHGEPAITESADRVRAAQPFLGRAKPVLLVGENRTRVISVGASLRYDHDCPGLDLDGCVFDSSPAEWTAGGQDADIVCYRDYTGRRLFGMVSAISSTETRWPGLGTVSFSVQEVDFTEVYV